MGAPVDDLVSDRPGARFAPRAIRSASRPPGPHLEAKVDALAALRVVDFGDAHVVPAAPEASGRAIEVMVRQVVEAGAIPIILGGDHSIVEPDVRAVAAGNGPLGLVHFDTHTDTGTEVFGVEPSHGTPMWALVEAGHVDRELGIDEVVRRAVQVVGDGPVYLSVDVGPGPGLCAGYGHARTGRDDEVSSCGRAGTWRGRSSSWAPR